MQKKLYNILLIMMLVFFNVSQVSGNQRTTEKFTNDYHEVIEISGKVFHVSQRLDNEYNYVIMDDGKEINTFVLDRKTNLVTLNGNQIGHTDIKMNEFEVNQNRTSSGASCTIIPPTDIKDETGKDAVFQACASYVIAAGVLPVSQSVHWQLFL